jgi:hypothetical protein
MNFRRHRVMVATRSWPAQRSAAPRPGLARTRGGLRGSSPSELTPARNARSSAFSELDESVLIAQIGLAVDGQACRAGAGMPRSMAAAARVRRSIWESLSSAPARLIFRAFGFAEPAFAFGFGDAGGQVVADLGDAGPLGGVWPVHGASQAGRALGCTGCRMPCRRCRWRLCGVNREEQEIRLQRLRAGQPGPLRGIPQHPAEVHIGISRLHVPQRAAEPRPQLLQCSRSERIVLSDSPAAAQARTNPASTLVSNAASSSGPAGTRTSRRSRTMARLNPGLPCLH